MTITAKNTFVCPENTQDPSVNMHIRTKWTCKLHGQVISKTRPSIQHTLLFYS